MSEPLSQRRDDADEPVTDGSAEHHDQDETPETIADADRRTADDPVQGMIPGRMRRRTKVERVSMRILATGGIIGLATALGAVLVNNDVDGWIVGLAVGLTSVILAALLWSSSQL